MSALVLDAGAFVAAERDDRALIARLLRGVDVRSVDDEVGRAAGVLIGRAGTQDPIDATLVLVAHPGDRILTSDPQDIRRLADAAGRSVVVIHC